MATWSDVGTAEQIETAEQTEHRYDDPVSGQAIEAQVAAWDQVETTDQGLASVAWNAAAGLWDRIKSGASQVADLGSATVETATKTVRAAGTAAEGAGTLVTFSPLLILGGLVALVLVAKSGAVRATLRN